MQQTNIPQGTDVQQKYAHASTFLLQKWCIVVYGSGALWGLFDSSVYNTHISAVA